MNENDNGEIADGPKPPVPAEFADIEPDDPADVPEDEGDAGTDEEG